jgi:hypothetical protein
MKLLLTAIMVLGSGIAVTGQHVINIGTGFKELEDPFVFSHSVEGNTLSVDYSFLRSGEAKRKSMDMQWDLGSLSGRGVSVKTNDLKLRFSQAFSIIRTRNKRLNAFLGYSIYTNPSFINVKDKEGKKYSWSTSSGLSLYQCLVYMVGRNRLALDIYVPVIGLASRPEEKDYHHHTMNGVLYDSYSDLFMTSLHNQRAVSASLDFSTALSKDIRVNFGGRYDHNYLEKEDVYSDNKAGLYAGISCSFK